MSNGRRNEVREGERRREDGGRGRGRERGRERLGES